jgi:hypothetical protein
VDPRIRTTAQAAFAHPWLDAEKTRYSEAEFPDEVFQNLRKIASIPHLKKSLGMYLAFHAPEKEVLAIKDMFRSSDMNGNGRICFPEFKQLV